MKVKMPVVSYDKSNAAYTIRLSKMLKSSLNLNPDKTYYWSLKHLDSENMTFCVEIREVKE